MNLANRKPNRGLISILSTIALVVAFMVPVSPAAANNVTAERIRGEGVASSQVVDAEICIALGLLGVEVVTEAELDAAIALLDPVTQALVTADVRASILSGGCATDTTTDTTTGTTVDTTTGTTVDTTTGTTTVGTTVGTTVDTTTGTTVDTTTGTTTVGSTVGTTVDTTTGTTTGGTGVDAEICAAINIGPDGIVVQAEIDAAIASTAVSNPALSARIAANAAVILGGACNTATTGTTTGATTGTTDGTTGMTTGSVGGATTSTTGSTTGTTDGTTGSTAGTTGSTTGSSVAQVTGLLSTGSGESTSEFVWPLAAAGSVLMQLAGHVVLNTVKQRSR